MSSFNDSLNKQMFYETFVERGETDTDMFMK